MRQLSNKLYSYKMSHDTRFAPNPFFDVLTLATCKSAIRRNTAIGNWIAGWTSKGLTHNPTEVGEEKLIYLAKVTEKLTYAEYWKKYPQKRPVITADKSSAEYHGDNIYEPLSNNLLNPLSPNSYIMHQNSHGERDLKKQTKELKGQYVLVCEEFYYFSCLSPLEIPSDIRPSIPEGQSCYGSRTEDASEFINYVRQHAEECKYTDAK